MKSKLLILALACASISGYAQTKIDINTRTKGTITNDRLPGSPTFAGTVTAGGFSSTGTAGWMELVAAVPLTPLAGAAAGKIRVAAPGNIFAISQDGKNNGQYYPPDAQALRLHRRVMSNGSSTALSIFGDQATITQNAETDVAPTATEPDAFQASTSAVSGNVAGIVGALVQRTGKNTWWSGYASIPVITSARWWFGLSRETLANLGSTSNCTGFTCAAFAFATDSGVDTTHYRCVTNNASGSPTDVASNVTVVAGTGHLFDIRFDDTNSKAFFFIDGLAVCSSPITTTLPGTGNLRYANTITALTTSAVSTNISWSETWSDR